MRRSNAPPPRTSYTDTTSKLTIFLPIPFCYTSRSHTSVHESFQLCRMTLQTTGHHPAPRLGPICQSHLAATHRFCQGFLKQAVVMQKRKATPASEMSEYFLDYGHSYAENGFIQILF